MNKEGAITIRLATKEKQRLSAERKRKSEEESKQRREVRQVNAASKLEHTDARAAVKLLSDNRIPGPPPLHTTCGNPNCLLHYTVGR
jgi:hypothetical protein